MALHLLQITDPHLLAAPDGTVMDLPPRDSLRQVVQDAREHRADRVLVTGDLSHDGTAASYEALCEELAVLEAPCYSLPGNHDDPATMADALGPPFAATSSFTTESWRILLLDSSVPDATHGHLSASVLDALDDALAADPEQPTLVALHHSPVPVGSDWLDPINLHDPDDLRRVLSSHPQVRLVLFGHVHQEVEAAWEHASLYGCPSTCFQFAPKSDTFALGTSPPGYRTLTLHADGTFETAVHRVPVPFRADPTATGY